MAVRPVECCLYRAETVLCSATIHLINGPCSVTRLGFTRLAVNTSSNPLPLIGAPSPPLTMPNLQVGPLYSVFLIPSIQDVNKTLALVPVVRKWTYESEDRGIHQSLPRSHHNTLHCTRTFFAHNHSPALNTTVNRITHTNTQSRPICTQDENVDKIRRRSQAHLYISNPPFYVEFSDIAQFYTMLPFIGQSSGMPSKSKSMTSPSLPRAGNRIFHSSLLSDFDFFFHFHILPILMCRCFRFKRRSSTIHASSFNYHFWHFHVCQSFIDVLMQCIYSQWTKH